MTACQIALIRAGPFENWGVEMVSPKKTHPGFSLYVNLASLPCFPLSCGLAFSMQRKTAARPRPFRHSFSRLKGASFLFFCFSFWLCKSDISVLNQKEKKKKRKLLSNLTDDEVASDSSVSAAHRSMGLTSTSTKSGTACLRGTICTPKKEKRSSLSDRKNPAEFTWLTWIYPSFFLENLPGHIHSKIVVCADRPNMHMHGCQTPAGG